MRAPSDPVGLRRVSQFREAVGKIVSLLTRQSVHVTQSGVEAYVKYTKDGLVESLNIPFIPDEATEDTLLSISGFLDHEVAHILFTKKEEEDSYYTECAIEPRYIPSIHSLWNLLEDTRIERLMCQRFPGSLNNLLFIHEFVYDTITEPKITNAIKTNDHQALYSSGLVPLFHAWAKNPQAKSFVEKMKLEEHMDWIIRKISVFKKEIPGLKTTRDSADLAVRIFNALNEPSPDNGSSEYKSDSGESSEDSSEDSSGEEDTSDHKVEGNSGSDDGKDKSDSSSKAFPKEVKAGEEGEEDNGEGADLDLRKIDNLNHAKVVSNVTKNILPSVQYLVYTTDKDVVKPVFVPPDMEQKVMRQVATWDAHLLSVVGPIQNHLRRILAQQNYSVTRTGLYSGRLHSPSLHRLATKDYRVYSQRDLAHATDTAVTLLVDFSGSMYHGKLEPAFEAAYAFNMVLTRLGISHEILCFSTLQTPVKSLPADLMRRFSRVMPIATYEIKKFSEKTSLTVRKRLAYAAKGGGYDFRPFDNADGESLLIAANRILAQPEKRKIIMVLSDGAPAVSCGIPADLYGHLKRSVEYCEKNGIETIGIGIKTPSVKQFYPKNTVIQDVLDLPAVVSTELSKLLLR